MTIIVRHPASRLAEREYIFHVVITRYLGLEFVSVPEDRDDVELSLASSTSAGRLVMPDTFLGLDDSKWLRDESLPDLPLQRWADQPELNGVEVRWPLPILFGQSLDNGQFYVEDQNIVKLGLDAFGSAFFMLTRYEELVVQRKEQHGRFSAQWSVAHREGFLARPLVDEYVEVLWASMKKLWPRLRRRTHEYKFFLSCDVDHPSSNTFGTLSKALRRAAGDVVRRGDWRAAVGRFRTAFLNAQGNYSSDPYNTFDFMMDTVEQYGLKGAFYFITGHSGGAIDGDYTLDMPWIRQLMRSIYDRGHEIGLHPSYNTFLDGRQIQREFTALLRVCGELGIQQEYWGGRQHYLRWQAPDTWQHWENAGLNYDSTLGFADHVGFRCGTCREFPVFNLRTRTMLDLIERPLIVMEGTLLGPQYMSVGTDEALEWIERVSSVCKRFNGNFTLLWHNSTLTTLQLKKVFQEAVAIAA